MNAANQRAFILCDIDDFCKESNEQMKQQLLPGPQENISHVALKRHYP